MQNGMRDREIDPDDHDNSGFITDDGRCSECGTAIDFTDLEKLRFTVEASGMRQVANRPNRYWIDAVITCAQCKAKMSIEMST